jgi:surface antigen
MPSFGERLRNMSRPKRYLAALLGGLLLCALIAGLALFLVSPLGKGIRLQAAQTGSSLSPLKGAGNSPAAPQATATAVANQQQQKDGYDPSANGSQTITDGSHSLVWPIGQCTYWANVRYRQLTGYWISWNGNADQWVAGARAAGWNASQTPHVPSIIVLMPGVQGANSYGRVAIVEQILSGSSPLTVHASTMNWSGNGGGWDIVSYPNFTVGAGVFFVWHP